MKTHGCPFVAFLSNFPLPQHAMTAPSKEVYWLEKWILDFIENLSQKKAATKSFIFDKQNRFKLLGIVAVALGGSYGLAKLYKYATYKPRVKPTPAEEAKKKEQDKKPQAKINNEFFQRLWYLIKIACPNLKSREFYSVVTLTFTVIAQVCLMAMFFLIYRVYWQII